MSLPWNRGGPEDSSGSLLDLLPLVPGSSQQDAAGSTERSVPRRVATAEGAGGGDRDSPRDRPDGDPLADVAPGASGSPGAGSPESVDPEVADGELSVRQ